MKEKIMVIDLDRRSRLFTEKLLKGAGYEVVTAKDFSSGYSLITTAQPQIIILDPLFPKKEGVNLIWALREWSDCPIIALSLNGTERAAVELMDAGADDFIRKPFFGEELLARVRNCIKHITLIEAAKGMDTEPLYSKDGLTVDYNDRTVTADGENIHLTKNEYKILSLLCRNSGKVLTYDFIMKSVWGPQTDGNTGILRVNIANLRKKLEKNRNYILTENGIGYRIK